MAELLAELAGGAIGDDRTDSALKTRSDDIAQSNALEWLLRGAEREEQKIPQQTAAPEKTVAVGASGSLLQKTARGVAEIPRQIVGGIRDASQSILDLGDWMEKQIPLGGTKIDIGLFPPRAGVEFMGPEALAKQREAEGGKLAQLPDVGKPETMIGGLTRGVTQFLAPFSLFGKAMGVGQAAGYLGNAGRAAAAGALTDFLAFEPTDPRLSNLVQELAGRNVPIAEYLAADPKDGEIEGRFKNALEGLGIGVAAEGLFRGVKAYRAWRNLQATDETGTATAEAMRTVHESQVLRDAGEMNLLGSADQSMPVVIDKTVIANRSAESAGVPDEVLARALTKRGLAPLEGAQDVFINFARIDTPEDIQKIINDTAQAFSEDIDKARRGIRTNSETILSADKIDAWQTLQARRAGEPLNAEQSVAARQLWATSADKLGQVAEIASGNPTPENLYQFRRMLATHVAIEKEVVAARSETARALQSWAIPVGGNRERMRDMSAMLERSGGAETASAMAQKVAVLMKTPDAANALSRFAEKSIGAKTLATVQEYWVNALLSGPKTHMVNMLSNTGVVGVSMLERAAAAQFRQAIGGEGVELGEAAAQIAGLRGGIFDAFRNAGKALRTGQTGFGMNKIEGGREKAISSGNWNLRSDSWVGQGVDAIGAITNTPGRLLQSEDEFFKTIGYRMELHAQAQRMVARELREGKIRTSDINNRIAQILDDPPEAIRMEAASQAAYQTFTSEPGKVSKSIQRFVGNYPGLRFVVPFINTPGNILNYTFERTPLAPITTRYRNAIAKGGADADLARTRMALGTMALLYGMDLAFHGNTVGSGPTNTSEVQNWRRQGNQPYSIKLGDKFYAYNRLDPLGYHLGISADIAEYFMNADSEALTSDEAQEAFAAGVFAVAENITSKSYMQGLSLLAEAVNDPDRFAASYMEKFATSFVPTGVREIATFRDPVQRQSHDIISGLKKKIPGMTEGLPARRDLWGRAISYQSGLGPVYDAVSPIYASGFKPEPIDEAMARDGWFIGMGGQSFAVDGEIVSLRNRPDIKNRYYELRGGTKPSQMGQFGEGLLDTYGDKTLLETLNEMVQGKGDMGDRWREAETADDRENLARRVFGTYGRAAKKQLFAEFPWIEETGARLKAQRLGLGTQ